MCIYFQSSAEDGVPCFSLETKINQQEELIDFSLINYKNEFIFKIKRKTLLQFSRKFEGIV